MTARSPRRGRRLSRSAEFERVYRQGRSVANRQLVLYAFANELAERPRLGLSVSRKVGGAVERNRIKRLLREAFERHEAEIQGGHDVVVIARPQAGELAQREGLDGIAGSLVELLGRAGLRDAHAEVPNAPVEGETATRAPMGDQAQPGCTEVPQAAGMSEAQTEDHSRRDPGGGG